MKVKPLPRKGPAKTHKGFPSKSQRKRQGEKGKQNTLIVIRSKGKPIFCDRNGEWMNELEEPLQPDDEIMLLALRT